MNPVCHCPEKTEVCVCLWVSVWECDMWNTLCGNSGGVWGENLMLLLAFQSSGINELLLTK